VTNWLADPVACAIRARDHAGTVEGSGCTILAGRTEALSRTTLVHRQETPKGAQYEWGHLFVRVDGRPGELRTFYTGVNATGHHAFEGPALSAEHANVMSDLLRAAVVNAGGHHCGGKSLYEMVWEEMMAITERLMTDTAAEDDVGAARAIAYVLAIMQNPYLPNVDAVREQVMEKWEAMEHEPPPGQLSAKENRLRERREARRARRG
jgi:hypothetical protein